MKKNSINTPTGLTVLQLDFLLHATEWLSAVQVRVCASTLSRLSDLFKCCIWKSDTPFGCANPAGINSQEKPSKHRCNLFPQQKIA